MAPLTLPSGFLLPITATWTIPFLIYQMIMASRVIMQRVDTKVLHGQISTTSTKADANTKAKPDPLMVAVRSHGNFIEYVPWALGLASLVELSGGSSRVLHSVLALLFVARIAHCELGMRHADRGAGPGRPAGFLLTQIVLGILAGYNFYLNKGYWGF